MKNLRELRSLKGYTCEELGKLVGVQKSAMSKYERGEIQPSHDILLRLAKILDTTTDFLLGITNEPSLPKTKTLPGNITPIIDSLERNSQDIEDLTNEEILELASQMEFTIQYVKNKRNPK